MTIEGRILIVEDQREWQNKYKNLLANELYEFTIAENRQKASDLLQHHTYDLVLLDLRLKDWEEGNFEGFKLLENLQKHKQESGTQTIIISAYGEPEHVRFGFKKYDIIDYIDKKRLDPNEFPNIVAKAIRVASNERHDIIS